MISIWSRFATYWQAKGWLWMGIAAVTCLAVCWLISERNNIAGTYDRFDFKVQNNPQQFKAQREYFPQSIAYDPYKDLHQTKRKVPQNSKGEEICRDTLQRLFQQSFPKCRPDFLFNSVTGRDKFYGQQYRDKMKRDVCKKLGITLIEVPYTVKHRDIPNFLTQRLRELNFLN
jgi:hypothetical protein